MGQIDIEHNQCNIKLVTIAIFFQLGVQKNIPSKKNRNK